MVIELKDFQHAASISVAERWMKYNDDVPMTGTKKSLRAVPFFQTLASITASGKTVILADAVRQMAEVCPVPPIILWLSRGKVVVEQTFTNLSVGGKYHHLLGDINVDALARYDSDEVTNSKTPLLYFATVGTFNQKDKEKGKLVIFKCDIDTAESSIWDAIQVRTDADDNRRPLIVVYDEGHNLSDQQTDLILELQPDAVIVASATMVLRPRLSAEVDKLKKEAGWTDETLVTLVPPEAVVESGLIKHAVFIKGYETPMEETVDSLLADWRTTSEEAQEHGVRSPKAIYVCKTNILAGDSNQQDIVARPFGDRMAPPILIWRHLTERGGVDADDIAVYCALKFDKAFPPPDDFHLFKNGDKDYASFIAGDYKHIIFNLSLQEGWDDPYAYFAYVDKSMESPVAVPQLVGRLLRQPEARRLPTPALNVGNFYVRVDKKKMFRDVIADVNKQLKQEAPEVRLLDIAPGKPKPAVVQPRKTVQVFETAYSTDECEEPVGAVMSLLPDFRGDTLNTRAVGGRTVFQRNIGDNSNPEFVWEEFEHTNSVSARWLLTRELLRQFPGAAGLIQWEDPRLDAMVGFGSPAHNTLVQVAQQIIVAYVNNIQIKQRKPNPYVVGAALVRLDEAEDFDNSVHPSYSDMNDLEREYAQAVDELGVTWCRNPSRVGYGIPLITLGPTRNFYPDFLVWNGDDVFAVDTTNSLLLKDKTARKLLSIPPPAGVAGRLHIRFLSTGKYGDDLNVLNKDEGYTVWTLGQDMTPKRKHFAEVDDAVAFSIKA